MERRLVQRMPSVLFGKCLYFTWKKKTTDTNQTFEPQAIRMAAREKADDSFDYLLDDIEILNFDDS